MMANRTAGGQCLEGIAVFNTPDQDLLHCVHAEAMDIVLQNNRILRLGNTVDNIGNDLRGLFCVCSLHATGITAADIPVVRLADTDKSFG